MIRKPATVALRYVSIAPGHRHTDGIPRRVVETDLPRRRRVGDVDDAQAAVPIGYVGIAPRHRHAERQTPACRRKPTSVGAAGLETLMIRRLLYPSTT